MSKFLALTTVAFAVFLYQCFFKGDGFEPESIRGQRVLITGASSGIGEQLAYQYCKLGAKVVIAARRLQRLEAVAQRCKELGGAQILPVQADLGVANDRVQVMKVVREQLGGLDHLILNHAVANIGWWLGTPENMTSFRNQMEINYISFVDVASQALDLLMASQGHIGVVSSIAGKVPGPTFTTYTADKFALQGFFGALGQEQHFRGTGISVTLCVIGPVDTEIARGKLTPEEMEKLKSSVMGRLMATAEDTAVAILRGVATRQPEIYYGRIAAVMNVLHKVFPRTIENIFGSMVVDAMPL